MVVGCGEGGVAVLHGAVGDDDRSKQSAQDVFKVRELKGKQGNKKVGIKRSGKCLF